MKIIATLVTIVVVGIVSLVFLSSNTKKTSQPVESGPDVEANYTLAVIENDVFIKDPTESDFHKITKEAPLKEGSEVKTSTSGRAKILYPNGTITAVEESSYLKLKVLDKNGGQSTIKLLAGGVWSKIKNVLGAGEFYQVETENVVASVRGTIFGSSFNDAQTTIYGLENKVNIAALDTKTGQTVQGTDTILASGYKVVLKMNQGTTAGQPLVTQPLTNEDLLNPMIERNLRTLLDQSDTESPELKIILERIRKLLKLSPSPSVTPIASPKISQTPKASPVPSPTPTPTPPASTDSTHSIDSGQAGSPQAGSVSSATPTPTPNPEPQLSSVYPKSIQASQQFTINGSNFITGRDNKQITDVLLNSFSVNFNIIDSQTIFATAANVQAGVYDVSVTTAVGQTLTLKEALEIK